MGSAAATSKTQGPYRTQAEDNRLQSALRSHPQKQRTRPVLAGKKHTCTPFTAKTESNCRNKPNMMRGNPK